MNVIEIFAKFVVDTSALDKAVSGVSGLTGSIGNGLASAAKIGAAAISATSAAVTAVGAASVAAGAEFDKSMSQVAATMGLTTQEMQDQVGEVDLAWGHFSGNLREYAQEMGKKTAFSATEAADALNYMALAGYSVQEAMEMLPNVLNLASAGAMDLATASDMITDTQTAFGISAERTTQMVDEMAKAASTGNTSVSQLGSAFLTVGALAKELNGGMVTLEDGTTATVDGVQELEIAFTAMANAGIKGSEAGTHMRNMIMKLSGPTSEGAKELKKMGVEVFDTEGKMRSLGAIFQELNTAMADMKQSEKINIIQNLFNARDLASAEALLGAVEGTVVRIGDETYSLSTAYEKFGDAIYDSTQGFEIVQSSWDYIGDSILDATGAAQQTADTQLYNLAGDVRLFKSALEGAEIAISDELTPGLREFVQFGTAGLSRLTDAFKEGGLTGAMEEFGTLLSEGLQMVISNLPGVIDAGVQLLSALVSGILDNSDIILNAITEIVSMILEKLSTSLEENDGQGGIIAFLTNLMQILADNMPMLMTVGFQMLMAFIQGLIENLPAMIDAIIDMIDFFVQGIMDNFEPLVNGAIAMIQKLSEALVEHLPTLIPAIVNMIIFIVETLLEPQNLITLNKAGIDILIAVIQGLVKSIPNLVRAIPRIIESLVEAFIGYAPDFLNLGAALIEGLIEGIFGALAGLIVGIVDVCKSIVDEFKEFFGIHSPSKVFDELGDNLIQGLIDGVLGKITDVGNAIGEISDKIWDDIGGLVDQAVSWGKDLAGNFADGISSTWSRVKGAVTNAAQTVKDNLHFSEPDEGPLSDFHTYAPDMMKLFAEGITSNTGLVTDAVQDAFNFGDAIMGGIPGMGGMSGAGLITPTAGRDLTVVLQVNEEQLGKVVYRLNNDEVQRVGVDLGKAVIA